MYTVKELIEALQQCPEDYIVYLHDRYTTYNIGAVGIDTVEEAFDIFVDP